jgi:hypothetical protein
VPAGTQVLKSNIYIYQRANTVIFTRVSRDGTQSCWTAGEAAGAPRGSDWCNGKSKQPTGARRGIRRAFPQTLSDMPTIGTNICRLRRPPGEDIASARRGRDRGVEGHLQAGSLRKISEIPDDGPDSRPMWSTLVPWQAVRQCAVLK